MSARIVSACCYSPVTSNWAGDKVCTSCWHPCNFVVIVDPQELVQDFIGSGGSNMKSILQTAPAKRTEREIRNFIPPASETSILPTDAAERKATPIATGVLDYFPKALAEIARVSKVGNDQHNPGEPLHWAREKSTDEADALIRHFLERGKIDSDGVRHSGKMAWRALALLEKELEGIGD